MARRTGRPPARLVVAVTLVVLVGVGVAARIVATSTRSTAGVAATTPLQTWLAQPLLRIAHRGGDADWPEGSPLAYRDAAAWNPSLALEFPARRTSDGVWVASEDATTGRVFGRDLTIATSTWAQLSTLRSSKGDQPMSRLQQTLLEQLPTSRILFVDDKADAYVSELLDLLDRYGGKTRTVIKSYCGAVNAPAAAHARGYTTWGYYYESDMGQFTKTQAEFDLLGMRWDGSAATYKTMLATGKRVIAHVVATAAQAEQGQASGATGLMVSGVEAVVPRGS